MAEIVPVIKVRYPNRRAVLASYKVDGAALSLFVPTPAPVMVGAKVRLEIAFGDCPREFSMAGQVTYRRAEARSMKLEPGLGIAFSGGDKYQAAQMLAFCAGRPTAFGTAADPRVEARIKCKVQVGKRTLQAVVRDISASGVFIAGAGLGKLPSGTAVRLTLEPGWFGWGGQELPARVVWSGDNKGMPGCGARFMGTPAEYRPVLKKYLGNS